MKRRTKWLALGIAVAATALAFNARAGTATFDFETNPTNEGIVFFGTGEWRQSGGNPGGYLKVTDAANDQRTTLIFPDLDGGLVIKAFRFECDLRIGGGTAPPADGFSVNYAREGDDVLDDGEGWAASPTDEANLPEEGTQTGLGVGFDEWFSGGDDVIGLSVRVDNDLILQVALPTVNGNLDDTTSLQTGPLNPDRDPNDITTSWALLGWARFEVEIAETGVLNLWWKGEHIIQDLQTAFFPSPGRIVFGGRTGGSNANHHVDNISLTTEGAQSYLVTGLKGRPDGFRLQTNDGAEQLDTSTIELAVNGVAVPDTTYTVDKQGPTTFITYSKFPELFPPGEEVEVTLTADDTGGVTETAVRTYITPSYAVVGADDAVPASSVDTSFEAFSGYVHQLPVGRGPGDGNNYWNAERHVNGGYIDPGTGQPYESIANLNDGFLTGSPFFEEDISVNYSGADASGNIPPAGNFRSNSPFIEYQFFDAKPPGLPGGTAQDNPNNGVWEFMSYMELNSGAYEFGVNSDDGFRVTAGRNARSIFADNAGLFNGGRGSSDTTFWIVAQADGFYPVRWLWWQGGGGYNCELFQVLDDGTKALLIESGIATVTPYPSSTVELNTAVVNTIPWDTQAGLRPDAQIKALIRDGASPLNTSSLAMQVNGEDVPVTTQKFGEVTHITADRGPEFLPRGENTVSLTWATNAGDPQTDTWTFTVVDYVTLPEWIARPVGSGTDPGMTATVHQLDVLTGQNSVPNRWHWADQQVMGLFGPNVATATTPQNIDVVNMDQGGDSAGATSTGIWPNDDPIPGIPGNVTKDDKTNEIAMEVVTYIEFPSAGYYVMGVNSDDGFRVVAREELPRTAMHVESPAAIAGPVGALSSGPEGGNAAAPLPRGTPLTGKVVMVDPPLADADLNNAASINGNIAMIDRGAVTYDEKIDRAQAAGAIAVIMVNIATPEQGPLPIAMGGLTDVTIPAVMISEADGDAIKAQLGNDVMVSLGLDGLTTLGEFNGGRGQDGVGTRFGFEVPVPGVYPFRLTWFEGGGGANVEWFTVDAAGTTSLINDSGDANAFSAFRTAPAVEPPTEITFNPPVVNTDGTITISWEGDGTLQEAATIPATWTDSADQSNPQTIDPGTEPGAKYLRVMAP